MSFFFFKQCLKNHTDVKKSSMLLIVVIFMVQNKKVKGKHVYTN